MLKQTDKTCEIRQNRYKRVIEASSFSRWYFNLRPTFGPKWASAAEFRENGQATQKATTKEFIQNRGDSESGLVSLGFSWEPRGSDSQALLLFIRSKMSLSRPANIVPFRFIWSLPKGEGNWKTRGALPGKAHALF